MKSSSINKVARQILDLSADSTSYNSSMYIPCQIFTSKLFWKYHDTPHLFPGNRSKVFHIFCPVKPSNNGQRRNSFLFFIAICHKRRKKNKQTYLWVLTLLSTYIIRRDGHRVYVRFCHRLDGFSLSLPVLYVASSLIPPSLSIQDLYPHRSVSFYHLAAFLFTSLFFFSLQLLFRQTPFLVCSYSPI